MEYAIATLAAIVFALLIVLVVLGYRQMKLQTLGKLEFDREFSTDGIFVGETLELIETAINPTWFPLFNVRMEFFVPAGLTVDGFECKEYTKLVSVFNLPPYSTVRKKHLIRADKRNRYILKNIGYIYRKYDFHFEALTEFYAYPDFFNARTELSPDFYRAGNAVSKKKYVEDPFFLSGIREYRFGDPMRSINFKVSARSFSGGARKLMCNEYDSSRTFDTMIFLDLNTYPEAHFGGDEQLENGLRYACFLFSESVRNGGNVGFCTNCKSENDRFVYINCASGELHSKKILEQFAELNTYSKRDYSMAAILQNRAPMLPNGTDIYLITPFVDEKIAETLLILERSGRNVQVIRITGGVG